MVCATMGHTSGPTGFHRFQRSLKVSRSNILDSDRICSRYLGNEIKVMVLTGARWFKSIVSKEWVDCPW